jgi:hypothetical protein
VEEGLAEVETADLATEMSSTMSRAEILAQLAVYDELIENCGPLPASLEERQDSLFEALKTAV